MTPFKLLSSSRFVQTGDLHTGESRNIPDYLPRHRGVYEQIVEHTVKRGVPLVITGDMFHSKIIRHEERWLVDWLIGTLERLGVPTIIIAGNHDHLYGETTLIDGYLHFPFQHVKIFGWEPGVHFIGDTGFICISWRGYTSAQLDDIVKHWYPHIAHCKYKVVVAHECILGARLDSGFLMERGTKLPQNTDITYWAVGDIHSHQAANLKNSYYAGAPAQFRFDDTLPKGVIVVDLDHPSRKPEFQPLIFKPLRQVRSVSEITDDAYYKVVGEFEDVLQANQHEMVVKSEMVKASISPIEYRNVGLADGLPEFLATKGIDEIRQKFAVKWIDKVLSPAGVL